MNATCELTFGLVKHRLWEAQRPLTVALFIEWKIAHKAVSQIHHRGQILRILGSKLHRAFTWLDYLTFRLYKELYKGNGSNAGTNNVGTRTWWRSLQVRCDLGKWPLCTVAFQDITPNFKADMTTENCPLCIIKYQIFSLKTHMRNFLNLFIFSSFYLLNLSHKLFYLKYLTDSIKSVV